MISPRIEMAKTLEWLNAKTQTIWWQLKHETWSNWSNPSPFRNLHSIIAKPTAEWFASNYRRISLTMMFERTEMMIPLKLWIVYLGCTNLHFGTESKMSYVKKKHWRLAQQEEDNRRRRRKNKKEKKKEEGTEKDSWKYQTKKDSKQASKSMVRMVICWPHNRNKCCAWYLPGLREQRPLVFRVRVLVDGAPRPPMSGHWCPIVITFPCHSMPLKWDESLQVTFEVDLKLRHFIFNVTFCRKQISKVSQEINLWIVFSHGFPLSKPSTAVITCDYIDSCYYILLQLLYEIHHGILYCVYCGDDQFRHVIIHLWYHYNYSFHHDMIIPHLSGEGCWILCPRRTSTASSRSQWSPPDPNSNLWFKVIPARPEQ